MKKLIIFALAAIVACSCSVLTHQRYVSTMFLDFQPYTETGFFISPNPYTGEFSPVGEISITVQPALTPKAKIIKGSGEYTDGLYAQKNNTNVVQEDISASELLELAVREAEARGANGISNFKCLAVFDADPVEPLHYEISGFAIRIKD
jgi:hypothetical protein